MIGTVAAIIMNCTYIFLRVSSNGEFPSPLSAAKEREHFLKYREGDLGSRNILIERNLRLVAHIVKKYYTSYKDQDDLISIGTIGLIKAIDTFKVDNGTRFATYACTCVKNEILMYFRSIKKIQSETSLYDSIDVDKDGNPLTYIFYQQINIVRFYSWFWHAGLYAFFSLTAIRLKLKIDEKINLFSHLFLIFMV